MTLVVPHALLLLQADPGRADEVASYVSALPAVTETAVTSGPYDVIVTIDLTDEPLAAVVRRARRAPVLCDLRVCRSGPRR